jgi:hypothetical protein
VGRKDDQDELKRRLVELYRSVGAPPYRELEKRGQLRGHKLAHSTVGDLLSVSRRSHSWSAVRAFVLACAKYYEEGNRPPNPVVSQRYSDLAGWEALSNAAAGRPTTATTAGTALRSGRGDASSGSWVWAGDRGRDHFEQRAFGQLNPGRGGDMFTGRDAALARVRDWLTASEARLGYLWWSPVGPVLGSRR